MAADRAAEALAADGPVAEAAAEEAEEGGGEESRVEEPAGVLALLRAEGGVRVNDKTALIQAVDRLEKAAEIWERKQLDKSPKAEREQAATLCRRLVSAVKARALTAAPM